MVDIDLTKDSVTAKCPKEDCSTALTLHESQRDIIETYKCRAHHEHLVIQEPVDE